MNPDLDIETAVQRELLQVLTDPDALLDRIETLARPQSVAEEYRQI